MDYVVPPSESVPVKTFDFQQQGVPPEETVPVKFFDFQKQQVSTVGAIEKIRLTAQVSFSVTHDGRWIAWKQTDRSESNLMLIDNFR